MENNELKAYKCHKIVHARPMSKGEYNVIHDRAVPGEDNDRGYEVTYNKDTPDHYVSWSPKKQFDEGYKEWDDRYIPPYFANFGEAIDALKMGRKVCRGGWNGKGIFLEMQFPDAHSKMTAPYIYINSSGLVTDNPAAPKVIVPWLASQTDVLAEDWMVID